MAGMNARLASYQGNINSQQYQLSQMQAFASAQQKVFDEQEKQAVFCSDYRLGGRQPVTDRRGAERGRRGALRGRRRCRAVAAALVAAAVAADTAGFDTPLRQSR